MSLEASKASRRRFVEHQLGFFPWMDIFLNGRGLDIGCGNDKLPFDNVEGFDLPQDANKLSQYFGEEWDYVAASQVLEHMHSPKDAFLEWAKVVKHGGHLIISVPEAVLYGDMLWGKYQRMFNPDHKATFSMLLKGSPAPIHIHVPSYMSELSEQGFEIRHCRLVDNNYDYKKMFFVDQTLEPTDMVECWIEWVARKL